MNWGLVIQGPVVSYGQGPNNSELGFSSISTIEKNVSNFFQYVSYIVVSTWENSGLDFKFNNNNKIVLIENKTIKDCDFDNRRKQFLTTLEGCKYLHLNTDVTHILKIRTDQLIDPTIIEWLCFFFSNTNPSNRVKRNFQEDYLVFSDMLPDNLFYVGDFIIAGTKNDLISFCSASLHFSQKNLHPSIGVDYVLKYLSLNDKSFWNYFFKILPLLFQISNKRNTSPQAYWKIIKHSYLSVIPSNYFESIIWRGKLMSDVLPFLKNKFEFYDDWAKNINENLDKSKNKKIIDIIPDRQTLIKAKYEYYRYFKIFLKFLLKKSIKW